MSLACLQYFVVKNILGDIVPVIPNGQTVKVDLPLEQEYVTEALQYRLCEFNRHVRLRLRCGIHVHIFWSECHSVHCEPCADRCHARGIDGRRPPWRA